MRACSSWKPWAGSCRLSRLYCKRSPEAAPVVLQMMKWGLGGFRVGKEIETVLDAAIAAAQQPEAPQQPDEEKKAEIDEKKASAFDKRAGGVKKLVEAQQTELQASLMMGQIPSPEQQAAAATEVPTAEGGGVPSMPPPMQGPTNPPAALNPNPMGAIQPGAGIPPTPIPGAKAP